MANVKIVLNKFRTFLPPKKLKNVCQKFKNTKKFFSILFSENPKPDPKSKITNPKVSKSTSISRILFDLCEQTSYFRDIFFNFVGKSFFNFLGDKSEFFWE